MLNCPLCGVGFLYANNFNSDALWNAIIWNAHFYRKYNNWRSSAISIGDYLMRFECDWEVGRPAVHLGRGDRRMKGKPSGGRRFHDQQKRHDRCHC